LILDGLRTLAGDQVLSGNPSNKIQIFLFAIVNVEPMAYELPFPMDGVRFCLVFCKIVIQFYVFNRKLRSVLRIMQFRIVLFS
jgi:hypothetical protein